MKATVICKWDYAGLGYRLADAINTHTDSTARCWRTRTTTLRYPVDRSINADTIGELADAILDSDVVMYNEVWPEEIGFEMPVCPGLTHMHHHGTKYRNAPEVCAGQDARADLVTVSTPCLTFNGVPWLPSVVDTDAMDALSTTIHPYLVAHMTTSTKKRNSGEILAGIKLACEMDDRLTSKLITGTTHEEAVRELAPAWASVDNLSDFSIGVGALEAMAMGIPVIASQKFTTWYMQHVGKAPFIGAIGARDVADRLLSLTQPKVWEYWSDTAYRYARDYHGMEVCARRAIALWECVGNGYVPDQMELLELGREG